MRDVRGNHKAIDDGAVSGTPARHDVPGLARRVEGEGMTLSTAIRIVKTERYTLYCGDFLDVMPALEAGSVDVLVADPPYGIGENNKKNLSRNRVCPSIDYGEFDWDSEPTSDEAIALFLSSSKQQVIFGGNYYAHLLPASASWIVWDKQNSGDFADFEMAWTSHDKAARMFRYMWNGMIKEKPEKRFHPTQKPLALMEWVIDNYTTAGDMVCDPVMGSGTTGVAAMKLGRNFIGIEKDAKYFDIAKRRIEHAESQLALFTL